MEYIRHIDYVVEHHRIGHQIHVLDALLLFDRITGREDAVTTEGDPI